MEEYRDIENSQKLNSSNDSDRVDFEDFDKKIEEHEHDLSKLKEDEAKQSSEKIKQLTGELFKEEIGEDIEILKKETIPPIEGVEHMQILTESEVLQKIIKSLYEISNQKIKDGKGNELVMENVIRDTVNSILGDIINTGKEPTPQIRQYLYKLLSDTPLYEEMLSKIGGPFILGANDRGNRGSSESWGVHMGVDYNLPKGTPVRSIHDGVVVGGKNKNGVFGDEKIIEAFPNVKKDADGGTGNTLIIKHEIGGKVFYSLYVHITDENFSQGQQVLKGQEVGKLAGYDTNGHWQPHLHFTIMHNLDNKNILHGYGKSEDLKDMVDPMKVYN